MRQHLCTAAVAGALLSSVGVAGAAERAAQCLIEPAMRVALRSAVSAQIFAVQVDRGSPVKKGQVLVLLDSTVERATLASARYRSVMEGQLRSAEAKVAHTEARLKRRQELHDERYVSAQDRDDAATELRVAQADLLEARDNRALSKLDGQRLDAEIGRRQLLSPIDGVVTERLQNPGELAQSGDAAVAILKLAQIDPARIEIILPAARFGRIKVGDVVSIKPEAPFTGSYKATVKIVDTVIDAASGTFGVRLEVPNPKHELPVGVKCVADL
jgi:RND family efflux transporter MFP subunit